MMEDNWDPGSRGLSMISSSSSEHNIGLDEALTEARRWIEVRCSRKWDARRGESRG